MTCGLSAARGEELPHHDQGSRARMLDAVLYFAEHLQAYPALIVACLEFDERPGDIAAAGGSILPSVRPVEEIVRFDRWP